MRNLFNLLFSAGFLIISSLPLHTQDFTVVAEDALDDNPQGLLDIKSLSYAMDKSKDSVWFRIETYDARLVDGDMGYAIAFDTDNDPTNGHAWGGEFSTNHSMKYDLQLYIFRDFIEPTIFVEARDGSYNVVDVKADVKEIDQYILQIGMKLSDINPSGEFNMIAGTGAFDIASTGSTYDDVPDDSYVSISASTGVREENTPVLHWSVSPEPVAGDASIMVELAHTGMVTLDVYDLEGRKVRTLLQEKREAGQLTIPLEEGMLTPGAYILSLQTGAIQSGKKIVVVK